MNSEQQLPALYQQLEVHRARLQELWLQKTTHEQAIAEIKARLKAMGDIYDTSPYDGLGYQVPEPTIPDEAREFVERALRGPWQQ